jgi:hypothetical protein
MPISYTRIVVTESPGLTVYGRDSEVPFSFGDSAWAPSERQDQLLARENAVQILEVGIQLAENGEAVLDIGELLRRMSISHSPFLTTCVLVLSFETASS